MNQPNLSSLIWSVAELLRGPYKHAEFGGVVLPFTVLRRLDCVLAPTKEEVRKEFLAKQQQGINPDAFLRLKSGCGFYNTSALDMSLLMGDQDNIGSNLLSYVQAFSPEVKDIFDSFGFETQIERLTKSKLLYLVTEKFANLNLHPDQVSNMQMGFVFEELIRRFAEASNEQAGDFFTPREVIRLMVQILFIEDDDILTKKGVVRTIYDPTAGTGGMLSTADEYLTELNPDARLTMYGQDINAFSYAICKADMLIKGQDVKNIVFGNTLSEDGHSQMKFDYMLANPPFGVDWKSVQKRSLVSTKWMGILADSVPGYLVFLMDPYFFCSIFFPRGVTQMMAAPAWQSFLMALPFSQEAQVQEKAKSDAMFWRMIWSKPSSLFPLTCITTPELPPISGYSPTKNQPPARGSPS